MNGLSLSDLLSGLTGTGLGMILIIAALIRAGVFSPPTGCHAAPDQPGLIGWSLRRLRAHVRSLHPGTAPPRAPASGAGPLATVLLTAPTGPQPVLDEDGAA